MDQEMELVSTSEPRETTLLRSAGQYPYCTDLVPELIGLKRLPRYPSIFNLSLTSVASHLFQGKPRHSVSKCTYDLGTFKPKAIIIKCL